MRRATALLCLLAIVAAISTSCREAAPDRVTMGSLLREMVDREAIARYPEQQPYRTLQASSYNRESVSADQPGWFADSDGVYCIRTEQNKNGQTEWVLMEDSGPGAITKIWAVCFYYGLSDTTGANIKIYLDGSDEPVINTNFFDFVRGRDIISAPLAAETRRAGNSYLPIPYARGCKVTMDKKVFYNIINYRSYPEGTPVESFTLEQLDSSRELIDSVNRVLSIGASAPYVASTKSQTVSIDKQTVAPGGTIGIDLPEGSYAIHDLQLRLTAADTAQALRSTVIKAAFDGEQTVWSPVGDMFCIGTGIKPYTMWERAVQPDGSMTSRWVMPYAKDGRIEFENLGTQPVEVSLGATIEPWKWDDQSMHFHSSWRMDPPTPCFPLFDFNLLEVTGRGVYVGDQFTVLNPAKGWWGEGDEKVYVDDDLDRGFPSHFGTGTEDYYGWAGGVFPNPVDEFDEPFLANVKVGAPDAMGYNTCTRTRVLDAIPFSERLKFDIEASSGTRMAWFHLQYSVSTYWYAMPGSQNNREELPLMAAQKITTLSELQKFNQKAKANKYSVDGAIEAENLATWSTDPQVETIDQITIWGELSSGAAKNLKTTAEGQKVTVRLTELFADTPLKMAVVTGPDGGKYSIKINGQQATGVELRSEHNSIPVIDLGVHSPVGNAIEIEFTALREGNLSVDYMLYK